LDFSARTLALPNRFCSHLRWGNEMPDIGRANAKNERLTEIPLISIIDDHSLIRAAIEDLVRSLGFSARTFASAESFLQSSSIRETGCLILDVQMPKMSGVDLQDHLSQNGFNIPIIFITAYSDEATKERALNAGAICFLRKPLDIGRRLIDCLNAALDRGRGPAPAT
jgi:FixJ family two-component response regulator